MTSEDRKIVNMCAAWIMVMRASGFLNDNNEDGILSTVEEQYQYLNEEYDVAVSGWEELVRVQVGVRRTNLDSGMPEHVADDLFIRNISEWMRLHPFEDRT